MALDKKVIAELERVVGTDHVRSGRGDVEPYARDATPIFRGIPDVVVWPGTAAEIAAILRLATQRGIPVVPRGAGSNLCGATAALTGGIVLVLTRMNRILEVSAEELLARVESGVTTTALSDGEHGVGAAKLPFLEARLGADQVALLRRIKTAFDPAAILNPGKLGS